MTGFVGRKDELSRMERQYRLSGNRCCSIYGRRRVGKTTLINEFCKDKRSVRFLGSSGNSADNLSLMKESMGDAGILATDADSYHSLFHILARECRTRSTVVVIDEFPEFIRAERTFSSILQGFIDNDLNGTDSFLIISGSSISSMREETEDYGKPLYGRFMGSWELLPLSYIECSEFVGSMSLKERMDLYCILGGIPAYYASLTGSTFEECLAEDILDPNALFANEVKGIVLRELSPFESHFSILSAIAGGSTDMKTIQERTGLSSALCSRYVGNMRYLGILDEKTPLYGADRRRSVNYIKDRFTDWYFSVIARNESVIETAKDGGVPRQVRTAMSMYLGKAFEHACEEYIRANYVCRDVGTWWGSVGGTDADIDIVAAISDGDLNMVLACECKYRSRPVGPDVLETLMERSRYLKTSESIGYVVFSGSGFTDDMRELADSIGATLVGLEEMYAMHDDGSNRSS